MTNYDELKNAAEAAVGSPTGYVERGANYAYEKLATPENILDLLAEREKLLKVAEAAEKFRKLDSRLEYALKELDK